MIKKSAILAILILGLAAANAAAEELVVNAAASLHDALEDVGKAFTQKTGIKAVLNFGSTSTLGQQIIAGSPCDVFFSANEQWMNEVEGKAGLAPGTRRDYLKGVLVAVVPAASKSAPAKPEDLVGDMCPMLAVGDPDHVPAGIYSKQSLTKLGLWDKAKDRLLPAMDVRAALVYVEKGEAACGLVYKTDAMISKNVRIAFALPEDSHDPIVYPVAQIKSAKNPEAAAKWLAFLDSPEARAIFAKYGFEVIAAKP